MALKFSQINACTKMELPGANGSSDHDIMKYGQSSHEQIEF
jgi:hypothetical protein